MLPGCAGRVELMRTRRAARVLAGVGALLTAALVVGCAPQIEPDDWTLEPIAFETTPQDDPTSARPSADSSPRTDVAFGFDALAADGDGGFWAASGTSWLHVGDDDETLAYFTVDQGDPLSSVTAMAALSSSELLVIHEKEGLPVLAVLDTSTLTMTDVPGEAPSGGEAWDLGDFSFADVAADAGDAILVRLVPRRDAPLDYEVLRVSLGDGARTVLHTGSVSWQERGPGLPSIDVDVDDGGAIHLATPDARIVLEADGSERSSIPQSATHPRVAVAPDGTALWWGGNDRRSDAAGVVIGGSDEARAAIEARTGCESPNLSRAGALTLNDADGEHPLPFLCGANTAAWTGSSWVVAIGGEGDGVLVHLRAPEVSPIAAPDREAR